jgi:hypothetical protein
MRDAVPHAVEHDGAEAALEGAGDELACAGAELACAWPEAAGRDGAHAAAPRLATTVTIAATAVVLIASSSS